jgi:hypothetical protein
MMEPDPLSTNLPSKPISNRHIFIHFTLLKVNSQQVPTRKNWRARPTAVATTRARAFFRREPVYSPGQSCETPGRVAHPGSLSILPPTSHLPAARALITGCARLYLSPVGPCLSLFDQILKSLVRIAIFFGIQRQLFPVDACYHRGHRATLQDDAPH